MFSILPVVLMVLFVMQFSSFAVKAAAVRLENQQVFDKLVSVADYTVKSGAVREFPDATKSPNWLRVNAFDAAYVESMRSKADLRELYLSLQEPDRDYPVCIHRLVAVDDARNIGKLYVCGG